MNDLKKDIIIATGGTGGHIFPAVSLSIILIKMDLTQLLLLIKEV